VIKIEYGRPGVKSRKIWGELVPYGLAPGNKYSEKQALSLAGGANENTTFESNKDLLVEGKPLPAGKYSIHMIPGETEWIVIFNKNTSAWGSYTYKQEEDALRVTVKPVKSPSRNGWSSGSMTWPGRRRRLIFIWVELKVPFKVQLAQ